MGADEVESQGQRMLKEQFFDRFERLIDVHIAERKLQFRLECRKLAADLSAKGNSRSSVHVHLSERLHARELEVRAILTWETIVRVHRTLGEPAASDALRADFKSLIGLRLDVDYGELLLSFESVATAAGIKIGSVSLEPAKAHVLAKHQIEVDLYVDSLQRPGEPDMPSSSTYNFYGHVGAVQTGAHAVASTVQNLGAEGTSALADALAKVLEALQLATSVPEQQKVELVEMAKEAQQQLASAQPNNTKLMATFNVLATAVQGIASAQPAYQALKVAVLPLGITLP